MKRLAVVMAIATCAVCTDVRGEIINLTMKQAVKMAVEKNLDLRNEVYNAAISKTEVRRTKGIYNTLLSLNVTYQDSTTLPSSLSVPALQRILKVGPAFTQLLPTGGKVGIQYNNTRTETDYPYSTYPDYWQSDVSLSVSQPLLRGFGSDVTNLNITLAKQANAAAIKRLATKIQEVVSIIRIEYFKLQSLKEDLQSKRVSLDLARRILNDIQERVNAGVLPPMEVLNAEYGVASREKDVIDAEKALKDQVDIVRHILQLPSTAELNILDTPSLEKIVPDENAAIVRALALRPEIEEAKISITSAETQRTAARNKTLPSLNLVGSYSLSGLSDEYGRNLDRLSSTDYPTWFVGIMLEYPLGNDEAEAEFDRSNLRVDQSKSQLQNLMSSVATDVRASVRAVEASFKQLDVTTRGRAFAEERLKAYISKAEVGLATTKDVLDVENDLATARTNQIRAHVTYAISVTQFLQATGQLLDTEGITVNGKKVDQLLGLQ